MTSIFRMTLLTVVLISTSTIAAQAAWPQYVMTTSQDSYSDILYDYEVWTALPGPNIRWYIIMTLPGGATEEFGPYQSAYDANWRLWFMYEHNEVPAGASLEVVERDIGPQFSLFDTVDTWTEAASLQEMLESIGLLVDIRRISPYMISLPPAQPVKWVP